MAENKLSIWDELRKPFPPAAMGLLPKVSCYSCAQATKDARSGLDKHCAKHKMIRCEDCGNYITEGHIHLDFVGHAAVTDRLNNAAGPENWTWEPLAYDEDGLPKLDSKGNLWIKLTVQGVTRLGYGDGSSSKKELIGDALRNSAMRFGIALDLWSKEELESNIQNPELRNVKPSEAQPQPVQHTTSKHVSAAQVKLLLEVSREASGYSNREELIGWFVEQIGVAPNEIFMKDMDEVLDVIKSTKQVEV